MKEEVPPALIQNHVKLVEEAKQDGKDVSNILEKSGIAGTEPKEEEGAIKPKEEPVDKKEEEEEVSLIFLKNFYSGIGGIVEMCFE